MENQQDTRTLAERVLTMDNDELLSRCLNSYQSIREMQRRMEYEKANNEAEEYNIFRNEVMRRMEKSAQKGQL